MSNETQQQQPDVIVRYHGTLIQFTPLSEAAKAWVDEHVQIPDYMRWGGGSSFMVENCMAQDLIDGMEAEGFALNSRCMPVPEGEEV